MLENFWGGGFFDSHCTVNATSQLFVVFLYNLIFKEILPGFSAIRHFIHVEDVIHCLCVSSSSISSRGVFSGPLRLGPLWRWTIFVLIFNLKNYAKIRTPLKMYTWNVTPRVSPFQTVTRHFGHNTLRHQDTSEPHETFRTLRHQKRRTRHFGTDFVVPKCLVAELSGYLSDF